MRSSLARPTAARPFVIGRRTRRPLTQLRVRVRNVIEVRVVRWRPFEALALRVVRVARLCRTRPRVPEADDRIRGVRLRLPTAPLLAIGWTLDALGELWGIRHTVGTWSRVGEVRRVGRAIARRRRRADILRVRLGPAVDHADRWNAERGARDEAGQFDQSLRFPHAVSPLEATPLARPHARPARGAPAARSTRS